ncbi:MAG: AMP-binding protein [Gammaproteobacteria bacterium]
MDNPDTSIVDRSLRLLLRELMRILFRVRIEGLANYHLAAPGSLIVANHVSLLDGVMLYLFLPEPPAFAIHPDTGRRWYVRPLLRFVTWREMDALNPIALKSIVKLLRSNRHTVVFPEGRITSTGAPMKVYDGAGLIADKAGAALLPIAIDGLQYSRWSRLQGLYRLRYFPRVTLRILPPRPFELDAPSQGGERRAAATARLAAIMREVAYANAFEPATLFSALARAASVHGRKHLVLEDAGGARLDFGQLLTRCFVLGSRIAHLSPPRARVGVMLPSTAAAVVTLFACLARGRVAAMLNFTAGSRGLLTAIETAGIRTVLTSRTFIETAGLQTEVTALEAATEVIYLEDLRDQIGPVHKLTGALCALLPRLAHRLLARRCQADDPAVILFTSGSEGIPKGVVLSHTNLLANYAQIHMLIDLTHRDRVLNVLPVFHAFGLLGGVLLPILKGAASFQYPSPLHYRIIPELCYEKDVTCLFGTTTFLRGYGRSAHPYDLHRMRFVIAGAERLTDDVRQLWHEKFGIRIFEGYGATEASPVIAVNHPLAHAPGTVGQLLAHIDHYLAPVSGIADGGELVVHGPNVMLGYLFHGSDGAILPPWTEARGAGWYATGDIVTIDANGYVSIRGRAKRFAKVGGEMVSLAAVEELAQTAWPDVRHAAVAVADPRKGEQIVLLTESEAVTRGDLVETVRQARFSELMVPRRVIHLAQLPLLGSGKIDYAALREQIE